MKSQTQLHASSLLVKMSRLTKTQIFIKQWTKIYEKESISMLVNLLDDLTIESQVLIIHLIMLGIIKSILVLLLLSAIQATSITILQPPEAAMAISEPIPMHLSPIGFRPLSGRLEGKTLLASPAGACSRIQDLHSYDEDFFVLADDSGCLESIKAKNIANSGAYVAIIKQNINNTLHDKEINLVHLPVVEISPSSFQALADVIRASTVAVTLSLDFTDHTLTHKVNLEVWFSPTEQATYSFLLQMRQFLLAAGDSISFKPHYVLQSQRESKRYIGCYSSGRYCPVEIEYEGKYEGINIVDETLRQIIIWKMSKALWWTYFANFHTNCLLANPQIFANKTKLDYCSEAAMLKSGIDLQAYRKEYNGSFLGSQKQVADNTYLLEERQHYIREQLSSHPAVLLNKKLVNMEVSQVQQRICKIQGQENGGLCQVTPGLNTPEIIIVVSVVIAVFVAIAALYRLYLSMRMREQIKGQVDRTLEQYYKYMDAFQDDSAISSKKKKPARQPLVEEEEQKQKKDVDIEMGDVVGH